MTDGIGPETGGEGATPRRLVWREAVVREIVVETPAAKSLVLSVPGWPGHLPGQHLDVRLTAEDGYQAQRSYSIASAPGSAGDEADLITLTVDRIDDGEVSPFLVDEVRVGDKLEVRGPIGGYFIWNGASTQPLQLLAGGSGVVPLMAMLRHRAHVAPGFPSRLLYSSRNWVAAMFRDELARLAAGDRALRVAYTLTRDVPPGWTEQRGRIDGAMLRALAFPPSERPDIFVCGPTPFVESVATLLVDWGHEPARIKTERFGPTGV